VKEMNLSLRGADRIWMLIMWETLFKGRWTYDGFEIKILKIFSSPKILKIRKK